MNASNPLKINRSGGFSLVELLTVITIIVILAGLTVGTMGWVQGKAAADKARAQMALLGNALERYHADTGSYPEGDDAKGLILYIALFGDGVGEDLLAGTDDDTLPDGVPDEGATVYLGQLDPNMNSMQLLQGPKGKAPTKIVDPFGNTWNYKGGSINKKTMKNPDFDLWSKGRDGKEDTDDDINNW